MANELVQRLLAQALQQQQPMLSPLQVAGKLALAMSLRKQAEAQKSENADQARTIAEAMTQLPPEVQQGLTAFSSLPEGTQGKPRYWGETVPAYQTEQAATSVSAQNDQKRQLLTALMAGNPAVGQQLGLQQLLGADELNRQRAIEKMKADAAERLQNVQDNAAMARVKQQGIDRVRAAQSRGPLVSVGTGEPLIKPFLDKAAASFENDYEDAKSAPSAWNSISTAESLLNQGINTGTGAELRTYLQNVGKTLGLTTTLTPDNTQQYVGAIAGIVMQNIKAFGSGTSLTDADREYAKVLSGGDISMQIGALRKLLALSKQSMKLKVSRYNERRKKIVDRDQSGLVGTSWPEITLPEPEANDGLGGFSSEDLRRSLSQ